MCRVLVTDDDPKDPTHYNCEHVIAKANGGKTELRNLAVSCRSCNGKKSLVDAGTAALTKVALDAAVKSAGQCRYHGSRCGIGAHSEVGAAIYDVIFENGSADRLADLLSE
jgi:hypothetical protein